MWIGYEDALALYMNAMIDEWVLRGYKNTMKKENITDAVFPWWFSWKPLHDSHKAALNRKDPEWYHFDVSPCFMCHGYIWPTLVPKTGRLFLCQVSECQSPKVHL